MRHARRLALLVCCAAGCGDSGGAGADAAPPADAATADASAPPPARTWSVVANLSNSQTFSDIRLNWGNSIAVTANGTVHVVWREVTRVNGQRITGKPVYRRRDDSGWTPVRDLAPAALGTGHPKITAAGNTVYIAWHVWDPDPSGDDDIFITISDADGAFGTFDTPRAVVTDAVVTALSPLQEMATTPSIAAHGDAVYLVWADDRVVPTCGFNVSEVYVQASLDRGATWEGVRQVTEPDCRSSWTPTAAAFSEHLHVAWTDERHSESDCGLGGSGTCEEEEYYRRLGAYGAVAETAEIRLTEDPADAMAQSWAGNIAAWDDQVHYAYMDNAGTDGFQVWYRRSGDRGDTWDAAARLSVPTPDWISARPTVAVSGDAVHVVWMDVKGNETARVFHRWSRDSGRTWSPLSNVSGSGGDFAVQPSVAVHGDAVHVIWNDLAEIFWATSP